MAAKKQSTGKATKKAKAGARAKKAAHTCAINSRVECSRILGYHAAFAVADDANLWVGVA